MADRAGRRQPMRDFDCRLRSRPPSPMRLANEFAASDLPPFQGGWAGMFGYELAGSLERVPAAADR